MRILAVADEEHPALRQLLDLDRWRGIELVLGCGDLATEYLDYLATTLGVPVLYVRGNHDSRLSAHHASAGEDIDGRVVVHKGIRIAGFEGSAWYGGQGIEYTELEMRWRVWRLLPRLWLRGGVDIVISHAPPVFPFGDACLTPEADLPAEGTSVGQSGHHTPDLGPTDQAHRGFASFTQLITMLRPRIWLHGHIHLNYCRMPRVRVIGDTLVVNSYQYYLFDI